MPLILPHTHTHTLGSDSTAILEPSVVELIIFAALSWSGIVLFAAIICYFGTGKQSIKDHDLEFYCQATWEDLVLSVLSRLVCTI